MKFNTDSGMELGGNFSLVDFLCAIERKKQNKTFTTRFASSYCISLSIFEGREILGIN